MGNTVFILFIGVLFMDDLQLKINEFFKNFDKYDDQILSFYLSRNLNVFIKDYLLKRGYYDLYATVEKIIREQKLFEEEIEKNLYFLDQFDIKIIGLKGYFLQKTYYKNHIRLYKDMDLLIKADNCYSIYSSLKRINYNMKPDNFIFYNNSSLFKIFKGLYINNVHAIDLIKNTPVKKKLSKWEKAFVYYPIEISSNLNSGSHRSFEHQEIFSESSVFKDFKNIYQPNEYHNILYLISHIMQHLAFYNEISNSLSINMQRIVDIFLIIENLGNEFNLEKLIELSKSFNIFPEVIFFLNLYNKIAFDSNYYDIEDYYLEDEIKKISWNFILQESRHMTPEDIIIGNYSKSPYLLKTIEKNLNIRNQDIRAFNIKKSIYIENKRFKKV